jgi:hypothetical protein
MSNHHHHTEKPSKKKIHQDWRVIVAVVLMLIAIVTYVMTLDEAVIPGEAPGTPAVPVPAAL